ncbi:MAG TPA: glycoside hydrolase family 6 protein [Solirubrobacteraceae bacterium]|nr:glycoside hydrolase family 6 protein [Solirubrobacteraceae bacterium]
MSILSRRSPLFALAGLWLALIVPTAARAATAHDAALPGSVELDQPAYTAHENQGSLTITIQRTGDLSGEEHVGYGVKRQDAQPGIDFDLVENHYITMAPGQATYTFSVHIIDQGMNATPVHALAYLYGSWPDTLGPNNNSMVTILHDDPLAVRDPANPLGAASPTTGNPLAGTKFYVDPNSGAAQAQARYRNSKPAMAALLGRIASEPGAHRFYMWNMGSNVSGQVSHYLEGTQIQQPGTTVMLSTYNLVHDHCGYTATPAIAARYGDFMHQVAEGIGNYHVVFFLELDSLITAPCLTHQQLAIREAELRSAVSALEADPHVVVYLDAGAADAVNYRQMARWLRASGVAQAQGFFLNSTHFDWTSSEIHYGQQISRLLGGAHFVVNTGENGRGPLVPKHRVQHGNEVLCNPPGRGLGPLSLVGGVAQQTAYAATDGLLWFSNPGGSGGQCVPGAPPTGVYWPEYGAMLARNWVNTVSGPKFDLLRSPFAPSHRK